jgi:hypothetical protein
MSAVEWRARRELQFQYRVYLQASDPYVDGAQARMDRVKDLVWVISGRTRPNLRLN